MGCNCGSKSKGVVSTVPVESSCKKTEGHQCNCGGDCKCKKEATPCLEDHSATLVQSVYTTTVTATDTWVMPAVDDCVQLHLKDVTNILPGSILWNKSVGYLHVSSYDATTGYVTACNEGEDENAEVGSTFPSCMSFHVGIPIQCNCDDGYTGACLAADVTSPGVGETTDISVTTVSGLFIGDIIDIADYMYKITAITDINTITVKNEGFGAPIGTVIKNDPNCTGKPCTVKITVVNSDDPCAKDPVNEGVIIVCDEGERKPFEGTADSQIAVWDNEDKKWKLRTVKLENDCTNLTADLTLDPLVTVYVITVEDTSIFEVGKTVYLDNKKFKVNSIINSTQMRIQIDTAPSAIKVIEEGAAICKGDCCEDIEFPEVPEKYSGFTNGSNSMSFTNIATMTGDGYLLKEGDTTKDISSDIPTITLASPSTNGKSVTVLGTITIMCQGIYHTDTHTYNLEKEITGSTGSAVTNTTSTGSRAIAGYRTLCTAVGPEIGVVANVKLNGSNLYSSNIESGKSYHLTLDELLSIAPPVCDDRSPRQHYSKQLILPVVFSINPNSTNTLSITSIVSGYELHEADGVKYNQNIRVWVQRVQTTVALAWIIQ